MSIISHLTAFRRDERGTQAIEFVLVAPIFLILLLGVVEIGRYILVQQKVSKTAYAINDIVSQLKAPTKTQIQDIFVLARDTMNPFQIAGANKVDGIIISATNNAPAGNSLGLKTGKDITWQEKTGTINSKIGNAGTAPKFTGITNSVFDLDPEEGTFVVEMSYTYNPIFMPSQFLRAFTGAPLTLEHNSVIRFRPGGNIPKLTP